MPACASPGVVGLWVTRASCGSPLAPYRVRRCSPLPDPGGFIPSRPPYGPTPRVRQVVPTDRYAANASPVHVRLPVGGALGEQLRTVVVQSGVQWRAVEDPWANQV